MGKKIIVIGGGVAGLSTGIYGQMNGFEMEIIEMHSITGGQCTAWDRKGYRFDYCLHWLVGTSAGMFYDIWRETDVITPETIILDHEIHTAICNEKGEEFIIYTNIDRWKEYLLNIAPEDRKAITKMCRHMSKAKNFEPFTKVNSLMDLLSWIKSLIKALPFMPVLAKNVKKNCKEYFADLHFKNQQLSRYLNSLFGERNFSALAFIMMLSWFDQKNAGYLKGGSLPLAKRMEAKFLASGGKLTTGKKVSGIIVEDNTAVGVTLTDGTQLRSDYVISAADGYSTLYNMLKGNYLTKQIKEAYSNWELFTPLVQVSFGINAEIKSKYPVQSIMVNGKPIGNTKLQYGYSLMNYSFDGTMAPKGKTVIVMRYESPWELWKDMSSEIQKIEKEKIKADAIAILEKHHPGIGEHIEVVDVATPLTTVKYTGVWKGSYEGFLPAANNIARTLKNKLPGLNNFYMAGQWLYPGGGLPPSVMSGKNAMMKICKDEGIKFQVK